MVASLGKITEETSEPINVQLGSRNLEEINMNKILELENCHRDCDLMTFIQHKNFFDLFNNSSNGFATSVEVFFDDFSIESTKKLLWGEY